MCSAMRAPRAGGGAGAGTGAACLALFVACLLAGRAAGQQPVAAPGQRTLAPLPAPTRDPTVYEIQYEYPVQTGKMWPWPYDGRWETDVECDRRNEPPVITESTPIELRLLPGQGFGGDVKLNVTLPDFLLLNKKRYYGIPDPNLNPILDPFRATREEVRVDIFTGELPEGSMINNDSIKFQDRNDPSNTTYNGTWSDNLSILAGRTNPAMSHEIFPRALEWAKIDENNRTGVFVSFEGFKDVDIWFTPDMAGTYEFVIALVDACNATSFQSVNVTVLCDSEPLINIAGGVGEQVVVWDGVAALARRDAHYPLGWFGDYILDASGTERYVLPLGGNASATNDTFVYWDAFEDAPGWDRDFNPADGFTYRWDILAAPPGSRARAPVRSPPVDLWWGDRLVNRNAPEGAPVANISSPNRWWTPLHPDAMGLYHIRLSIDNACSAAAREPFTMDVLLTFACNAAPQVITGTDILETDTCLPLIKVNASASYDPDEDPLQYTWMPRTGVQGKPLWGARNASNGLYSVGFTEPREIEQEFLPDVTGEWLMQVEVNDGCLAPIEWVNVTVEWAGKCEAMYTSSSNAIALILIFWWSLWSAAFTHRTRRQKVHPFNPEVIADDIERLHQFEEHLRAAQYRRMQQSIRDVADKEKQAIRRGDVPPTHGRPVAAPRAGAQPGTRGMRRTMSAAALHMAKSMEENLDRRAVGELEKGLGVRAKIFKYMPQGVLSAGLELRYQPAEVPVWRLLQLLGVWAEFATLTGLAFTPNARWHLAMTHYIPVMALIFPPPGSYVSLSVHTLLLLFALFSPALATDPNQQYSWLYRLLANLATPSRLVPLRIRVWWTVRKATSAWKYYHWQKSSAMQQYGEHGVARGHAAIQKPAIAASSLENVARIAAAEYVDPSNHGQRRAANRRAEAMGAAAARARWKLEFQHRCHVLDRGMRRVAHRVARMNKYACFLVTEVLIIPIGQTALNTVTCTYYDQKDEEADGRAQVPFEHVATDESTRCWTKGHFAYAALAVINFTISLPLALSYAANRTNNVVLTVRELPFFAVMRCSTKFFLACMAAFVGSAELTRARPLGEYGRPVGFLGDAPDMHAPRDTWHLFSLVAGVAMLLAVSLVVQPVRMRGGGMNNLRAAGYCGSLWATLVAWELTLGNNASAANLPGDGAWYAGPAMVYMVGVGPVLVGGYLLSRRRSQLFSLPNKPTRDCLAHKTKRDKYEAAMRAKAAGRELISGIASAGTLRVARVRVTALLALGSPELAEHRKAKAAREVDVERGRGVETEEESLVQLLRAQGYSKEEDLVVWILVLQVCIEGWSCTASLRLHALDVITTAAMTSWGMHIMRRMETMATIKRMLADADQHVAVRACNVVSRLLQSREGCMMVLQSDADNFANMVELYQDDYEKTRDSGRIKRLSRRKLRAYNILSKPYKWMRQYQGFFWPPRRWLEGEGDTVENLGRLIAHEDPHVSMSASRCLCDVARALAEERHAGGRQMTDEQIYGGLKAEYHGMEAVVRKPKVVESLLQGLASDKPSVQSASMGALSIVMEHDASAASLEIVMAIGSAADAWMRSVCMELVVRLLTARLFELPGAQKGPPGAARTKTRGASSFYAWDADGEDDDAASQRSGGGDAPPETAVMSGIFDLPFMQVMVINVNDPELPEVRVQSILALTAAWEVALAMLADPNDSHISSVGEGRLEMMTHDIGLIVALRECGEPSESPAWNRNVVQAAEDLAGLMRHTRDDAADAIADDEKDHERERELRAAGLLDDINLKRELSGEDPKEAKKAKDNWDTFKHHRQVGGVEEEMAAAAEYRRGDSKSPWPAYVARHNPEVAEYRTKARGAFDETPLKPRVETTGAAHVGGARGIPQRSTYHEVAAGLPRPPWQERLQDYVDAKHPKSRFGREQKLGKHRHTALHGYGMDGWKPSDFEAPRRGDYFDELRNTHGVRGTRPKFTERLDAGSDYSYDPDHELPNTYRDDLYRDEGTARSGGGGMRAPRPGSRGAGTSRSRYELTDRGY